MADKVVKKDVKTKVKKGRRLKRSIRKTFGALFLATAIAVAAIPTDGLQAASNGTHNATMLTWDEQVGNGQNSKIPLVTNDSSIYTTENGLFQFAWIRQGQGQGIAVILGYDSGNLDRGRLTIPDEVDAYTLLNANDGNRTTYVAVSRSGKPLYYRVPKNSDTDSEEDTVEYDYLPCYGTNRNVWGYVNGAERPLSDFWYKDSSEPGGDGYKQTGDDPEEQWIRNITVAYIGNQVLRDTADGWEVEDPSNYNTIPSKGVFAENGNITELTVGENLLGIGNYAFYGCTTLSSITLGNGIQEIGHHAFYNCINMTSIGLQWNSQLTYISDYAFANCSGLIEFHLPANVTRIFDHAFDGCTRLRTLDLSDIAGGRNTALNEIGYYAFYGCSALTEVVLPEYLANAGNQNNLLHLNNFAGCTNLKHIQVLNESLGFTADAVGNPDGSGQEQTHDGICVNDFKAQVDPTFYFEAGSFSGTHDYTQENAIAFKYAGEDRYEIIILEDASSGGKSKLTYQVNSRNELMKFDMEYPVDEVTIPSAIGPYGVSTISEGSFGGGSGSCFLKKITIPGTVKNIGMNAFKGCHELQHVIFLDAASIESIDTNAFATQLMEGGLHTDNCPTNGTLTNSPVLTFTGEVGEGIVPFDYAMNPNSNINEGGQGLTYITYYSGWPSNLEIQFVASDPVTHAGAATLVSYPTLEELSKYSKNEYPYMTDAYIEAAQKAVDNYRNNQTAMTTDQWAIIDAALNVSVPMGVKRIATGLFSGKSSVSGGDAAPSSPDTDILSVTFADIEEFEPYTFSGCSSLTTINITGGKAVLDDYAFAVQDGDTSNLTTINMTGGGGKVGDYAFDGNKKLVNVTLSDAVNELGLRPFRGCEILTDVNFSDGGNFITENCIIYGLSNGSKTSVIECLESRGSMDSKTTTTINADELKGITSMSPEAFMGVSRVGTIHLESSSLREVPARAFADTANLHSVYLPDGCINIQSKAFHNSNIQWVEIPRSVAVIATDAFDTEDNLPDADSGIELHIIEFYCEPGTAAAYYAETYDNIVITDRPDSTTFIVQFWYYTDPEDSSTGVKLKEEMVPSGEDATPPEVPEIPGYRFVEWRPDYHNISTDATIIAYYLPLSDVWYTVTFYDDDQETVLFTKQVREGEDVDVSDLRTPVKQGFIFDGWLGRLTNITRDESVYAHYRVAQPGEYDGTGTPGDGTGGNGNPSGSGDPNDPNNPNNPSGSGSSATLYTLTVVNGSGSGSYVEGAQPIIIANNPASGQVFDHWTISPDDTKIASTVLSASVITMPATDVTVTAHYKAGSGTSGSGTTGSGNNAQRPNGSESVSKGGTTVVIDKNGLSNTGVVSVTVHGSSDDFVIKISDSAEATEAALRALMAEYGDDLTNIRYFPMDISLYDSTGTYKITDTTGLSVDITLPLPDSLITYAGNNKVASVAGSRLERLGTRFSTIQGVSCVTFTAEHFSPYVIYVDLGDLSSGLASDSTPKTGDGIHPKWFLSIGLACLSLVFFMQKDNRKQPKKAKVKVRAR